MTVQETAALPAEPQPLDTHAGQSHKKGYWQSSVPVRLDMAKRETFSLLTNREIRRILEQYSYTEEKINRFVAAYDAAVAAQSRQQKEFGDKVGAYDDFEKIFIKAKENFSAIRKIAKVALRNHSQKANQIGLYQKGSKSIPVIFHTMQEFYDNINDPEILSIMAEYGYNADRIANNRADFIKSRDAYNLFVREDSEAVDATKIRDIKMAALDDWMMDYYAIAKVALANRPEFTTAPDENLQ